MCLPSAKRTSSSSSGGNNNNDSLHHNTGKKNNENGCSSSAFFLAANIINDLVPNGMLPLASGLATTGTGPLVGCILVVVFAVVSWATLCTIGRLLASETTTTAAAEEDDNDDDEEGNTTTATSPPMVMTIRVLHERLLGERAAKIVDPALAALCFWCCVAYLDFASDLLCPIVDETPMIPLKGGRAGCIVSLCSFVLLPLCLLKDVSALAPFSVVGVLASLFVVFVMVLRCADGSYVLPGGEEELFFSVVLDDDKGMTTGIGAGVTQDVVATTTIGGSTGNNSVWRCGFSTFGLVSMISVGFLSHYNVSEYYFSLVPHNNNNAGGSLAFETASGGAFFVVAVVYVVSMTAGYWTFGERCESTILNNYHPTRDKLATLGKAAIGTSLLTSFPLMFNGLRRSVASVIVDHYNKNSGPPPSSNQLTVGLLLGVCVSSLLLPDVGFIVSVIGAVFGSATIYAMPGILAAAHNHRRLRRRIRQQRHGHRCGAAAATETISSPADATTTTTTPSATIAAGELLCAVIDDAKYYGLVAGAVLLCVAGLATA